MCIRTTDKSLTSLRTQVDRQTVSRANSDVGFGDTNPALGKFGKCESSAVITQSRVIVKNLEVNTQR